MTLATKQESSDYESREVSRHIEYLAVLRAIPHNLRLQSIKLCH
jgi:hypothetical protein